MPYLPFMFYSSLYKKNVADFMDQTTDSLNEESSLINILRFYGKRKCFYNDEFIPVVDDHTNLKIVGSVRSWNILEYIKLVADSMEEAIVNGDCEDLIEEFCSKISSQYAGEQIDGRTLFLNMPGKLKDFI